MANRSIKRLNIDEQIIERCIRNKITSCKDVLSIGRLDLQRLVNQCDFKNLDFIKVISKACLPKPVTALELYKEVKIDKNGVKLSLDRLDEILVGGLPVRTLSEICGPSGCGKTQFCIMLTIVATMPMNLGGMNTNVIFIDTEAAFSVQRLQEIAINRFPSYFTNEVNMNKLMQQIVIHQPNDTSDFRRILDNLEYEILDKKIGFVIIDSIASLVRKEYGTNENFERTDVLSSQAALLKYLAESFSMPILVTNQITTRFQPKVNNDILEDEESYVTSALGNTWSHCVNTRLILQYLEEEPYRQIMIAKSPIAPFAAFKYIINESGIVLQGSSGSTYKGSDPGKQKIRTKPSTFYI